MKPISNDRRNQIQTLISAGGSTRTIARAANVSHQTVYRVSKQFAFSVCSDPKLKGGRPQKLDARDRRALVRCVTSGRADTSTDLLHQSADSIRSSVSPSTIRRALKQEGLKSSVKQKKPLLLPRHKSQRLSFARKYQDWTEKDWARVLFSDETKINRLGADGRKWVWKRPHSQILQQHVKQTLKFGGGGLMFWGCMSSRGVGHACKVEGGINSTLYIEILGGEMHQSLRFLRMEEDGAILQQDNAPAHMSRAATEWFNANRVELLDWPAQSPDLNPIEHLWDYLKRRLSDYEQPPESIHKLWERVQVEWEKITPDFCARLVNSMPQRIQAVLDAKGGHTKY
jgi:transposase